MQVDNLERAVALKRRLEALNEQIATLNVLVKPGRRIEIALDIQPSGYRIPLPDSLVDNVLRLLETKLKAQYEKVLSEIDEL